MYLLEQLSDPDPSRWSCGGFERDIDPSDYEVDGVLTELALEKLREVMPEVPADEITSGLTANDIPRLFRVQTFINIVTRLLAEKGVTVS